MGTLSHTLYEYIVPQTVFMRTMLHTCLYEDNVSHLSLWGHCLSHCV
jgi:hypothetical protein